MLRTEIRKKESSDRLHFSTGFGNDKTRCNHNRIYSFFSSLPSPPADDGDDYQKVRGGVKITYFFLGYLQPSLNLGFFLVDSGGVTAL